MVVDPAVLQRYKTAGLAHCPNETRQLYTPTQQQDTGKCGLEDAFVNLNSGCRQPGSCSKLEARKIRVAEVGAR